MRLDEILQDDEGIEDDFERLSFLDDDEKEFWVRLYKRYPDETYEWLTYLTNISWGSRGNNNMSTPFPSAAARKIMKPFNKNGGVIYKGSDESPARPQVTLNKPTFWSRDIEWAQVYGDVVLQTNVDASDIILDLTVVPFVLGPEEAGREDEVILDAGTYNVSVSGK